MVEIKKFLENKDILELLLTMILSFIMIIIMGLLQNSEITIPGFSTKSYGIIAFGFVFLMVLCLYGIIMEVGKKEVSNK